MRTHQPSHWQSALQASVQFICELSRATETVRLRLRCGGEYEVQLRVIIALEAMPAPLPNRYLSVADVTRIPAGRAAGNGETAVLSRRELFNSLGVGVLLTLSSQPAPASTGSNPEAESSEHHPALPRVFT